MSDGCINIILILRSILTISMLLNIHLAIVDLSKI